MALHGFVCSLAQVMSSALQVPSADHLQLQAQSTDGFLNLLLLADSSLEDPSRSVDQPESTLSYSEEPEGALVSMADESRLSASNDQQSSEPDMLANGGHHTVAGIACSCARLEFWREICKGQCCSHCFSCLLYSQYVQLPSCALFCSSQHTEPTDCSFHVRVLVYQWLLQASDPLPLLQLHHWLPLTLTLTAAAVKKTRSSLCPANLVKVTPLLCLPTTVYYNKLCLHDPSLNASWL